MKRVIYFGTYEKDYPRNRLFIKAISNNFEVMELHSPVWDGYRDKTKLFNPISIAKLLFSFIKVYGSLFLKLKKTVQKNDIVFTGFPGQIDLFFLIIVKIFLPKIKIVSNPLVSFYDTIIEDRALLSVKNPLSKLLKIWEGFLFRRCSLVITDTLENKKYLCSTFNIKSEKVDVVYVGADVSVFYPLKNINKEGNFSVLFYGKYIPLHGIENIVEAVAVSKRKDIKWIFVGEGQLFGKFSPKFNELIEEGYNVEVIKWIKYEELNEKLNSAHLALGVFGETTKSKRVIPNKLFQAVASNVPVLTAKTKAIKELFDESTIELSDNTPESIAKKIIQIKDNYQVSTQKSQKAYSSFFGEYQSVFGVFEKKLDNIVNNI